MQRKNNKLKLVLTSFAMLLAVSLNAQRALADSTSFTLGTGNVGGLDCCTGPYANVTVNRTDTTHATVTFDSLTNGGFIYLMADGGSVAVNVNGPFTLGAVSGSNSIAGFTPGPYSNGGAGNEDGFGSFNQTINSFDGFTHSSTQIVVPLTLTSGTWATANDVLAGNGAGNLAAIHGFACAQPGCSTTSGAFATGFASVGEGGGGGREVPEPSALLLLGAGLVALSCVARRFNRAN